VPHLAAHGADEEARAAAASVMRYFDSSANHHHDDEEHDLFPALIESMAGSDAVCLRDLTEHSPPIIARSLPTGGGCGLRSAQIAAGTSAHLSPDDVEALVGGTSATSSARKRNSCRWRRGSSATTISRASAQRCAAGAGSAE
jgi:hypothetical protein